MNSNMAIETKIIETTIIRFINKKCVSTLSKVECSNIGTTNIKRLLIRIISFKISYKALIK